MALHVGARRECAWRHENEPKRHVARGLRAGSARADKSGSTPSKLTAGALGKHITRTAEEQCKVLSAGARHADINQAASLHRTHVLNLERLGKPAHRS